MKRRFYFIFGLLLCCLGTLSPIRAATVTGNLLLITGASHPDKKIVFTPDDTPRDTSIGTVLWTPTQVTSVGGVFSATLGQGSYRVSIDGIVWRRICVPAGDGVYSFHSPGHELDCGSGTAIYLDSLTNIFTAGTNIVFVATTNDSGGSVIEINTPGGGDDHKVLSDVSDATPGYLLEKLSPGAGVTSISLINPTGTNDMVQIDTLWTQGAGFIAPTADPNNLQLWQGGGISVGSNTPAFYGSPTSGEALAAVHVVSEGDPNLTMLYLSTSQSLNPANAIGALDYEARTNRALMVSSVTTNNVTWSISTDLNLGDPAGGNQMIQEFSAGGVEVGRFQPVVDDGPSAFAWKFGTYYPLTTDGSLIAEFQNAGTNLMSVGNAGQLYFGPGQTNVLYRSGTDLFYSGLGFWVTNTFGQVGGLDATSDITKLTASTGSQGVGLRDSSGRELRFTANEFSPTQSNTSLGSVSGGGFYPWGPIIEQGTNYNYGFGSGGGTNFARVASWHGGTNDAIHFDSQSSGTAGPPRPMYFDFGGTNALYILRSGTEHFMRIVSPGNNGLVQMVASDTTGDSGLVIGGATAGTVQIHPDNVPGNDSVAPFEFDAAATTNEVMNVKSGTNNQFKIMGNSGYTGAGTKYLSDDGTYKIPAGGVTSANWTASGTTNATLSGTGFMNSVVVSNSFTGGGAVFTDSTQSALSLRDTAANLGRLLSIDHLGGTNGLDYSYGLDIHNYAGANRPFVVHQYSSQTEAVRLDNVGSQPFIQMKNATNGAMAPGVTGSGAFLDMYSYDAGVQYHYGDLSDQLVFRAYRAGKPFTFQPASAATGLAIEQNYAAYGLAITQGGAQAALVISVLNGADGYWPMLIYGLTYGPNFQTTRDGGDTVTIQKGGAGTGRALFISNSGTGDSIQVTDGSVVKYSVGAAGDIATGGNTNRWVFKGIDTTGGNTNLIFNVNGKDFWVAGVPH